MADRILLPSTTYQPPSPPQGRKQGRHLNTIMEEDNEETSMSSSSTAVATQQKKWKKNQASNMKIEEWLSPLSDHFPTPRGIHFLAAPVLPSSPSTASADESNSPTSSTNPSDAWNRPQSVMTDATEFDDLYDVSDEEPSRQEMLRDGPCGLKRRNGSRRNSGRQPLAADSSRKDLTPLLIPPLSPQESEQPRSARLDVKCKVASPVPPTPTSIVTLSPTMRDYMQAQLTLDVPTISAPPSLDGSLTSDQMAQMSAPPTPVIGGQDEPEHDWSGVQLQPGALATLEALSGSGSEADELEQQEQVIEIPQSEMSEARVQPPRLITNLANNAHPSAAHSPAHRAFSGLTRLEIPSPGGFFSGLTPRTRRTWSWSTSTSVSAAAAAAVGTTAPATAADEANPPTSTTAEQFYKAPWNEEPAPGLPPPPPRPLHLTSADVPSAIIEQVVEFPPKPAEADLPTAIRVQYTPRPVTAVRIPESQPQPSASLVAPNEFTPSPVQEVVSVEMVARFDQLYAHKQEEVAVSHLDRTERWLVAQRAYLKGVDVIVEEEEDEDNGDFRVEIHEREHDDRQDEGDREEVKPAVPEKDMVPAPAHQSTTTLESDAVGPQKKTVRFSEVPKSPTVPAKLPSKLVRPESAYYRAFTDYTVRSLPKDAFTYRQTRFEALQAQRVSLREAHRNQLLGKYQLSVVPLSAKKRMSANVVRGDDVVITDDPDKLRADKEGEALSQSSISAWHVAATKLLNGGRLIAAPVHKRLARLSRMQPGPDGVSRDRARILDLAGQSICDWAWHVALQYPNTKIYTVTTKSLRQMSNCNIRGPPNHRQVAVDKLTKLPFADNQFDLISARDLQSVLKFIGENGEDEWETCLQECMRVLKPGGYLEFSVMDSGIVNAGPLGNAKAVEFGFSLKTLGYDPNPTRLFLGRLARAGFEDPRRAWMCLPMGPRPASESSYPVARDPETGLPIPTVELEAMVSGSAGNAAAVTGFAASWSWERWLLRAEIEATAGELRLSDTVSGQTGPLREAGKSLEGVHAIVEEGRRIGSCWRVLRGYARKPRSDLGFGFISMCLDA